MTKTTKTFGRDTANDVVINDPAVSSHHARITYLGNDEFVVEDLESTNGTFVNGVTVKKARLSKTTKLKLANVEVDFFKAFNIVRGAAPKNINAGDAKYKDEFLALRTVWQNYQKNKHKINTNIQLKSGLIRSGIIIGILLVVIWYSTMTQQPDLNPNVHAGISPDVNPGLHTGMATEANHSGKPNFLNAIPGSFMIISTLAGVVAMFATSGINANQKIQDNYEDFFRKFVCFECDKPLGNFSWDHYSKTGVCPYCGTSFLK